MQTNVQVKIMFIVAIMLLLASCGTTKVYFKDCERVDNGYICEK
jgi:hypothetical protein